MKKMLKFAAALMSAVMLLSSVNVYAADSDAETNAAAAETTAEAAVPFTDVNAETQTGKNILKLYNAGIIAGYEDGTFRPDGNITRAELVRIFNQVFEYKPTEAQLANVKDFLDNTDPEAWYYNDVRIAQIAGYINGFDDNTFRGKENFTRQQACVVIDLITGVNTADPELVITDEVSEWAVNYVNWALTAGLFPIEEGNTFRATQNITRAEVCNLLEIFVAEPAKDGDTETATTDANEKEEEEVTVKTSNGTVVKITKGGSGGGGGSSSSSGNNAKSTTTASVENSTETTTVSSSNSKKTTEAKTETTTASSKNTKESTTKQVVTEKKTETTTKETTTKEATTKQVVTEKPTQTTTELEINNVSDISDDVAFSLENVYLALNNYVVPNCSSSGAQEVASMIRDAMYQKMNDHSYDITGAVDAAVERYRTLSSDEKNELKNNIISYCSINDLYNLQATFFPYLTYNG